MYGVKGSEDLEWVFRRERKKAKKLGYGSQVDIVWNSTTPDLICYLLPENGPMFQAFLPYNIYKEVRELQKISVSYQLGLFRGRRNNRGTGNKRIKVYRGPQKMQIEEPEATLTSMISGAEVVDK
jgi:hypothetical protein